MNETTLVLIVASLVLVLVIMIIGMLWFFGSRFLKLKELERSEKLAQAQSTNIVPSNSPSIKPEVLEALRNTGPAVDVSGNYCTNHPDQMSLGTCTISGDSFCEHCLTTVNDVKMAKQYVEFYLNHEWIEIISIQNKENEQEIQKRINEVKKKMWEESKRPLLVQGQYKINTNTDQIESFTVILSRLEDKDFFQKELSFIQ